MSRRKSAGSDSGSQAPGLVASPAYLADQREVLRVRMQRLPDELVGHVGTVELGGVDVVHAEFDRPPQHGQRFVAITRRSEHAGPRKLHRAEAHTGDRKATERKPIHGAHPFSLRPNCSISNYLPCRDRLHVNPGRVKPDFTLSTWQPIPSAGCRSRRRIRSRRQDVWSEPSTSDSATTVCLPRARRSYSKSTVCGPVRLTDLARDDRHHAGHRLHPDRRAGARGPHRAWSPDDSDRRVTLLKTTTAGRAPGRGVGPPPIPRRPRNCSASCPSKEQPGNDRTCCIAWPTQSPTEPSTAGLCASRR